MGAAAWVRRLLRAEPSRTPPTWDAGRRTRLWPPPQTAGAPLAHHTARSPHRPLTRRNFRSLAGGSQGGIALEMGVPEACKYFMKVTAAGLSTSDAAAYLISEKGVSKMTVAQALCTAETMDPKFGAVQGHP